MLKMAKREIAGMITWNLYLTWDGSKWLSWVEYWLTTGEKVKERRGCWRYTYLDIDVTKNYGWNNTGQHDEESAVKMFKEWGWVTWGQRMAAMRRGSRWKNSMTWNSKLNVVKQKGGGVMWKWHQGAGREFLLSRPSSIRGKEKA